MIQLYNPILYYTILYYPILYYTYTYTIPYHTIPYHTILYYTVLHCYISTVVGFQTHLNNIHLMLIVSSIIRVKNSTKKTKKHGVLSPLLLMTGKQVARFISINVFTPKNQQSSYLRKGYFPIFSQVSHITR